MINIYTSANKLSSNEEIIVDNEVFFGKNVDSLTNDEIRLVSKVDNFEYLGNNKIETPYGICSIYDISTGSKTIVNVLRNKHLIFDVTECGNNALNILFKEIDNTEIRIILQHTNFKLEDGLQLHVNEKFKTGRAVDFSIEVFKGREQS